jgi:hypothetical protein
MRMHCVHTTAPVSGLNRFYHVTGPARLAAQVRSRTAAIEVATGKAEMYANCFSVTSDDVHSNVKK